MTYDSENVAYPGSGPKMGLAAEAACLQRMIDRFVLNRSADNECVHGALPDDRYISCACWGKPKPRP